MSQINWQRTIDQIILTGTGSDDRLLGLTSVKRGSGVSLVCRYLARTLAADRMRVLLLDLSEARSASSGAVSNHQNYEFVRDQIITSAHGYDLLSAHGTDSQDGPLVDLPQLRELLGTALSNYSRIVIDMPPLLDGSASGVNAVAAGSMCDRLLIITRIGHDKRGELTDVLSMLRDAGVRPSAILANKFK